MDIAFLIYINMIPVFFVCFAIYMVAKYMLVTGKRRQDELE